MACCRGREVSLAQAQTIDLEQAYAAPAGLPAPGGGSGGGRRPDDGSEGFVVEVSIRIRRRAAGRPTLGDGASIHADMTTLRPPAAILLCLLVACGDSGGGPGPK